MLLHVDRPAIISNYRSGQLEKSGAGLDLTLTGKVQQSMVNV